MADKENCNTYPKADCNERLGDSLDKCLSTCDEKVCTENTDLSTLIIINDTLTKKFTELDETMDDFQTAMYNLCYDEGLKFDAIGTHMNTLIENNEDCCDSINNKLSQVADLIETMDINT